jgi:hypothetical protein
MDSLELNGFFFFKSQYIYIYIYIFILNVIDMNIYHSIIYHIYHLTSPHYLREEVKYNK